MCRYKHSSSNGKLLPFGWGGQLEHASIRTISIPCEEVALGHFSQVVLVQEFATLPFLTKPTKPMLAYQVVEVRIAACSGVLVWARRAQRAVTLKVGFACWTIRIKTMAICL
jgi:hypothetical protein